MSLIEEAGEGLRSLWAELLGMDEAVKGTAHTHTELIDGCFRCDLNRDEMGQDT